MVNEKEIIQKAFLYAENISKTGRVTVDEMEKALAKASIEKTFTVIDDGNRIVIKYNESNRYYSVNSNGNIEGPIEILFDSTPGALGGVGTEAEPFVIMSIEDLVFISKQINNKVSGYANKYFILGKTLDFNSDLSYGNPNTTDYDEYLGGDGTTGLKEQLTKGKGFVPIGLDGINGACFFDGRNYEIKNIYENRTGIAGLFGYIMMRDIQH